MSIAALREDNPLGFAQSLEAGGEKNGRKDADFMDSPFRKYSRIGPAVNSDSGDMGRRMELEADAAIKYRTCSWQKVGFFFFSLPAPYAFERMGAS
jgi:hypothetical protein